MTLDRIQFIRRAVLKATFDAILARGAFSMVHRYHWRIADERYFRADER